MYNDLLDGLSLEDSEKDPKTELQEYLQGRKQSLPTYYIVTEEGEAHERIFTVECEIEALDERIKASGKSKRAAEQSAAQKVLNLLQKEY